MGRAGVTVHGKGRLLWLMMFWNGQGCILESFADSSLKCKSLLKLFKFFSALNKIVDSHSFSKLSLEIV